MRESVRQFFKELFELSYGTQAAMLALAGFFGFAAGELGKYLLQQLVG